MKSTGCKPLYAVQFYACKKKKGNAQPKNSVWKYCMYNKILPMVISGW